MVRLVLAAAVLLLAAPVEAKAASPLDPAFGKTVVSTYPDGRTAKLWLQPDGTYRGQSRSGRFSSGRWTLNGERVCFRQSRPVPVPFRHCAPVPKADPGQSWTGKAVTGEPIRLELVAGGAPAAAAR